MRQKQEESYRTPCPACGRGAVGVRWGCGGAFGFVPARHPVLMATECHHDCHLDRRPPSCHPERTSPPCHPERSPLVIPSVRRSLVIPSAAEGSGCEWEVRRVRRQMSRLRFAPLDTTKGTNSLVGMRSARPRDSARIRCRSWHTIGTSGRRSPLQPPTRVRSACAGAFGFVPACHPVLMVTGVTTVVISTGGRPLVIPSAAEGSGCESEVRHVRRQMSRLRFAPLDTTKGTNSPVGMRSARPRDSARIRCRSWHVIGIVGRRSRPTTSSQAVAGMKRRVFRERQRGRVPICETGQNPGRDSVIPAEAGIQKPRAAKAPATWIPAPFGHAQGGLRGNDKPGPATYREAFGSGKYDPYVWSQPCPSCASVMSGQIRHRISAALPTR